MGRWARSKQLASASWGLLRHDKELMLLPLISGIASLVIAGTFMVPIFLTSKTTDAAGSSTFEMNPLGYVLLFLMYLVLAYVTIFFKTALLCGADERMQGGEPSLGSALSGASSRAGKILPWAIVTATVSIILRSLEERAGILGRIVIGIVGMAWAVVTFLVLPIVVFENVGRNEHNVIPDPNSIQGWGVGEDQFAPGDSYAHVFDAPGVYAYVCTIHGVNGKGMVGIGYGKAREVPLAIQKAVDAGKIAAGASLDQAALQAAGLARGGKDGVRLLGKGELTAKLSFSVAGASKGAIEAVEKAGGKVDVLVVVEAADKAKAKKGTVRAARIAARA